MSTHEAYIERCIRIAKNGLGTTSPNPMVGCVIVHNDLIIGEGFTSPYGGPHAEVNAIHSVKKKALLKESTLYVTLEPCSHFGKTPPCSDLIIENNIPRVIIGCQDDNPEVAGRGIEKLKASGSDVIVGVLEAACKIHHKRFFTFYNKKRPFIILKWAQTKDGFIAPSSKKNKSPVWITNATSRQLVHKWRSEEQAILIGTNTALEDNPTLTVRTWTGRSPLRVVIDRDQKLSKSLNIFNLDAQTKVVSEENTNFNLPIAKQICDLLYEDKITSLIIEGGAQTLQTFIDENLWDEARVFTGNSKFHDGIPAPNILKKAISEQRIDEDLLSIFNND